VSSITSALPPEPPPELNRPAFIRAFSRYAWRLLTRKALFAGKIFPFLNGDELNENVVADILSRYSN
jgi:hypothetical protein